LKIEKGKMGRNHFDAVAQQSPTFFNLKISIFNFNILYLQLIPPPATT